jgi:hypothetical protein
MLEEQRWGLAILVSQKLVRALPKPMWGAWGGPFQNPRGVLGEGPSKTHVGCLGRALPKPTWGAWGGPVEKL